MTTQPAALPVPVAALGEGPCWDDTAEALYWIDVPAGQVHRLNADDGHASWDIGQPVGAVAVRSRGGLAIAASDGFVALDLATGRSPPSRRSRRTCRRTG